MQDVPLNDIHIFQKFQWIWDFLLPNSFGMLSLWPRNFLNTHLHSLDPTFPETARCKGSEFHTRFLFANNANLSPKMILPCPASRLENGHRLRCRCQGGEKKSFLIAELGLKVKLSFSEGHQLMRRTLRAACTQVDFQSLRFWLPDHVSSLRSSSSFISSSNFCSVAVQGESSRRREKENTTHEVLSIGKEEIPVYLQPARVDALCDIFRLHHLAFPHVCIHKAHVVGSSHNSYGENVSEQATRREEHDSTASSAAKPAPSPRFTASGSISDIRPSLFACPVRIFCMMVCFVNFQYPVLASGSEGCGAVSCSHSLTTISSVRRGDAWMIAWASVDIGA